MARAALVTIKGFRDPLELARGNRTNSFRIDYRRAPPLIPRRLRFEVEERIHGRGEVLAVPDPAETLYGVIAEADGTLDLPATKARRRELGNEGNAP